MCVCVCVCVSPVLNHIHLVPSAKYYQSLSFGTPSNGRYVYTVAPIFMHNTAEYIHHCIQTNLDVS